MITRQTAGISWLSPRRLSRSDPLFQKGVEICGWHGCRAIRQRELHCAYVIGYWILRFSERTLVRRAFTVLNANDFSCRNRVANIPGSLRMIAERPLLGHGWNHAEKSYTSHYETVLMTEGAAVRQNDLLMFGMNLEIPAMRLFLCWIALGLRPAPTTDDPLVITAAAAILPLLSGILLDGLLIRLATALPFFCLLGIAPRSPERARPTDWAIDL